MGKPVISISPDPFGIYSGSRGCWSARIKIKGNILYDAGDSIDTAINNLLSCLRRLKRSDNRRDYQVRLV